MRALRRRGITGIETAIIVIAIVLVAAAFAFVIMNMGFAAVQKTGEVVTKGTEEAASSIETAGTVLAVICHYSARGTISCDYNPSGTNEEYIVIFLKSGVGGMPVDMNRTAVTFSVKEPSAKAKVYSISRPDKGITSTATQCASNPIATINATQVGSFTLLACVVHGDNDNLLEVGEKWALVINVTAIYGKTGIFDPYLRFRVEVKPPVGAILTIERAIPAAITPVMETW